jgi:hypothetical protein
MNAHAIPVRAPDPFERDYRRADLTRALRMIAEADEILTRTLRIVNRLHPAVPMPDISGPVLDWTAQRAFEASKRERERLFKRIKPMVEAKVRAVPSDEALRMMMGGSAAK